jgi:hypothetical protein
MITETLLFIILAPGLLLTIPPIGKNVFMSGKTSVLAVIVHAAIFAGLLYYLKTSGLLDKLEPFQDTTGASTNLICYPSATIWTLVIAGGLIGGLIIGIAVFFLMRRSSAASVIVSK